MNGILIKNYIGARSVRSVLVAAVFGLALLGMVRGVMPDENAGTVGYQLEAEQAGGEAARLSSQAVVRQSVTPARDASPTTVFEASSTTRPSFDLDSLTLTGGVGEPVRPADIEPPVSPEPKTEEVPITTTTQVPTTVAPVTVAPVTEVATTVPPVTEAPTTAGGTGSADGWVDAGHGVMVPPVLLSIRWCESRDDYTAANPASSARGAYQFLTGSWAAYGHADRYGVDRAHLATPAQQDEAAVITWQASGTSPWNASKHCWG